MIYIHQSAEDPCCWFKLVSNKRTNSLVNPFLRPLKDMMKMTTAGNSELLTPKLRQASQTTEMEPFVGALVWL